MHKRFLAPFLLVSIVIGAAALRLYDLGNRPMHCDEAVHADKFRLLLEHADYTYNPYEYHGPSLNFLTLPIARAVSAERLTQITETHLRLLPAIFGIALVGLLWLIRDGLGRPAALCAAVLTAVSPAMVFYSRYYIQEMLLVCFSFGAIVALWRYARLEKVSGTFSAEHLRRHWSKRYLAPFCWLVLLGVCVGMMHASKETCVIALFAMALAALATRDLRRIGIRQIVLAGVVAGLTAAGVSMLFFSSFLENPKGIIHSVTTYFVYLGRSSGEGSVGRHVYPWYDYFHKLFWWQGKDGPLWSEASIAVLALVGIVAGALGRGVKQQHVSMARFLGVYTVLMTLIYSALPYKTPWCALGFLHGMILLAGVGAAVLIRVAPGYVLKGVAVALLIAATGHLGWQARQASFVYYEHPDNPFVYAHTTNDVLRLVERIEQISTVHSEGRAMPIQVICADADYWPLPWYLRGFSQAGFLNRMPRGPSAPLIVTQPEMEAALAEYLLVKQPPGQRYLYVPVAPEEEGRDWQLRPNVPLRVYVRLDLWDAYQRELPAEQVAVPEESPPQAP